MSHQMALLLLLTLLHGHVSVRRWQWHTCGISVRRTLWGITFNRCMRSCTRRTYCLAVSYNRKFHQCTLHDNTDTQSECVGHVYVNKQDFDEDTTELCADLNCLPDQFCGPSCAYKECRPIPHVPYAAVYGNILNVGAKVKYVCTATDDVTIVTCQSDGQWSTLPVCLADCGNPQTIPNTTLSSGNTSEGSSRHYTCLAGYGTGSDVIITCQANGQWTLVQFQCLIDCGTVSLTMGTSMLSVDGTLEGGQYTFICSQGYTLYPDGMPSTITCLSNGSWEYVPYSEVQCLPDTIGVSCLTAADCTEGNSRCLDTGSPDYGSRCYCQPLYEYNRHERTCAQVCSAYGTTYRLRTPRIFLHRIEETIRESVDECLDHCVDAFGDESPSFKYHTVLHKCKCLSATLQQTSDGCPELVNDTTSFLNFYERDCIP